MTSTWNQVREVVDAVLELPPPERGPYLDRTCPEPKLRRYVESLILSFESADGFLDDPGAAILGADLVSTDQPLESATGSRIGPYLLREKLGEGGMGAVYRAARVDQQYEKEVAIKLVKAGFASEATLRRFRAERQILAKLDHPNIGRLFDGGVTQGAVPYFVMELVKGEPIDAYCDSRKLNIVERLRLFCTVCSAVQYAHQNLVVHRDLKPGNILVTPEGAPKLLDFGIAKILNPESFPSEIEPTLSIVRMLTPEYASPEQVRGEAITTASDLYSLGVVLYLLLTGHHPYPLATRSPQALMNAICEMEPTKPSIIVLRKEEAAGADSSSAITPESVSSTREGRIEKLVRRLSGDLDTIVLTALRKEPQRRYATPSELAADCRRYLNHEPIQARPASLPYRMKKYVRRHRTAVALVSLTVASLIAGLTGTIIQARRARVQRDFAFRELSRSEAINDLENFLLTDAAPSGKPFTVDELLNRAEQIVERQHGTDADRVELLVSIGRQYSGEDQAAKALRVLEHAYQLSRGLQDHTSRSDASCALGGALAYTQDLSRAEALFHEGLNELPQEPQYVLDRSFCLLRGREIADARGDSQAAIARVQEAQHLLQQSAFDSEILQLRVSIDLAEAYREAGRYSQAINAFEQASTRLSALGRDSTETAGTLYNNWAMALLQVGRPLEAERVFRRALEISRSDNTDAAVSATLLLNYGKTLRELGRLNEAADYAERAYAKVRQAGDEVVTNQSLLECARIYREQHKLARATEMLTQVEPRLRRDLPPTHYAFASLASERSLIALGNDDLEKARQLANEAVAIDEAAIKSGGQGAGLLPVLLFRRSAVELELRESGKARADAERALNLLQDPTDPGAFSMNVGRAYLALGRALQAQGKPDEADAAFRSAAEHLERTLGTDHPESRAASVAHAKERAAAQKVQ